MDGQPPPWRILDSEVPTGTSTDATAPSGVNPWPIVLGALSIISVAVAVAIIIWSPREPTASDGAIDVAGDLANDDALILVVEVEGAVAKPGVYRLPDGNRVGDAIAAAGGYSPRVDATAAEQDLNLATILSDGDRIVVPSRDASGAGVAPSASTGSATSSAGRVDLNSATQAELEALPGIGPVTAGKIIAARDERPFRSAAELLERKVVGKATFEKIRDLVSPAR